MVDWPLLPILILATPSAISPHHVRAALRGRPSYWDAFALCLGMQTPLSPKTLNEGEYPAVAAMTTGYVFRVENEMMVSYLLRVSRTGHLVTLDVVSASVGESERRYTKPHGLISLWITTVLLYCGAGKRVNADWLFVSTVSLLLLSRIFAIISLRARAGPSWHGAPEPGVKGDLLILLSQDRWVRMRGLVDDLKAVTSGSCLREPKYPILMQAFEWTACVLVYLATVLLGNARWENRIVLVLNLLISHGTLVLSNAVTKELKLNDRTVKMSDKEGGSMSYDRRLDLARQLIKETGRSDWAIRLGMISPEQVNKAPTEAEKKSQDPEHEIVTM